MSSPLPRLLAAAAALAVLPAGASAQTAPRTITRPSWAALPTEDEVALSYPRSAFERRVGGEAAMRCQVEAGGALGGCRIVRESPPGEGFGLAVLALAPKFRLKPATADGSPAAGGVITIPLRFTPPTLEQIAAAVAPQPPSQPGSPARALGPAPTPGVVFVNPKWRKRPSPGDVGRVYPGMARREGQTGQVVMQCGVQPDGRLRDCAVMAEGPPGYGFGKAGLKLAPLFQAEVPPDADPERWRVTISMTIGFEITG
ncbi:MAG TPA: TonB family protein [Caulobacteraceae bacterium]|jgi:TonB family protein